MKQMADMERAGRVRWHFHRWTYWETYKQNDFFCYQERFCLVCGKVKLRSAWAGS